MPALWAGWQFLHSTEAGGAAQKRRAGHGAVPHPHQAALPRGLAPGRQGGFAGLLDLAAKYQDPHFLLELLEVMSSRANAVSALSATDRVLPSPTRGALPKAKFSHPISWVISGGEIFQPLALATPLYSASLRLPGGIQSVFDCLVESCCGWVLWSVDLLGQRTDTPTQQLLTLSRIACTNGLVHGVARGALSLRRSNSGAFFYL